MSGTQRPGVFLSGSRVREEVRSKCSCGLVEVENFLLTVLRLVGYNSGFPVSSLGSSVQIPFWWWSGRDLWESLLQNWWFVSSNSGQGGRWKKGKGGKREKEARNDEETGDPPSFLFVSFYSIFMNYKYSNIQISTHVCNPEYIQTRSIYISHIINTVYIVY